MFDLTLGWIGRIGGNHRILLPKLKVSCLPPKKNTQEKCRTFSFSHTYSSFPPYHQCSIRFGIFVGGYSTNEYHSIPNWIPNYSINFRSISWYPHSMILAPPAHRWHLLWTEKSLGPLVRSTCNKRTTGASTGATQKRWVLLVFKCF